MPGVMAVRSLVVLMLDIDTSGAMVFAERLRLRIESLVVTFYHENKAWPFTISLE
jgi:PleD family two-component response regulator